MNAPCKNCPKRHTSCHSTCPDYLAFVAEREKIRKAKYEYYAYDPKFLKKIYKRRKYK